MIDETAIEPWRNLARHLSLILCDYLILFTYLYIYMESLQPESMSMHVTRLNFIPSWEGLGVGWVRGGFLVPLLGGVRGGFLFPPPSSWFPSGSPPGRG